MTDGNGAFIGYCPSCPYCAKQADPVLVGKQRLVCRRYPPTMYPISAGAGGIQFMSEYPVVVPELWCGEHPRRKAKVGEIGGFGVN